MSEEIPQPLSLPERLDIVYQRLDEIPAPTSAQEALAQLSEVLDAVEDEYSGVPRDPNPGLAFDGRMYPPRDDFIKPQPDGGLVAITKGNRIEIGPDGSTTILSRRSGDVVYNRPAADTAVASDRIRALQHRLEQSPAVPAPEREPDPPREHPSPGPEMDLDLDLGPDRLG